MMRRKRKNSHRVLSAFCAVLLIVTVISPVYVGAAEPVREVDESLIAGLLAAGEYVEGEAIVLMREGQVPQISAYAEEISDADADSVRLAVSNLEESEETEAVADEAEVRVSAAAQEDRFSVQHIVDHGKTTEELLRELYEDPDVISAEPNYIIEAPAALYTDVSEDQSESISQSENVTQSESIFQSENVTQNESAAAAVQTDAANADDTIKTDPASQLSASEMTSGGEDPASQFSASEMAGSGEDPAPLLSTTDPIGSGAGDLTPMQWYAANTGIKYQTPGTESWVYAINVPGWEDGRTDENAQANASGTICVFDSGIDVTHPDLKDVLYEFTPEQQARYGCGPYGMNASGDGLSADDVTDFVGHGTHVAGIIAAKWNGFGTSGIANGVRVFSVRMFGAGTTSDMVSALQGFQFLIDAAQEINLKAVNCSWGSGAFQFLLTVMVNELGKKGVNTVFSSGNRGADNEEDVDTGACIKSVYAINVNAAVGDKSCASFSNRGQSSTDLFSPGVQILSTVPESITVDQKILQDNIRFYPEATAAEDLVFGIERFAGTEKTVRLFDANPVFSSDAAEIGAVTDATGFDDHRSASISVASLKSSGSGPAALQETAGGSVFLAIPVSSAQDAKWISVKCASNSPYYMTGTLSSITCADGEGNPVQVDSTCSYALANGARTGAQSRIQNVQWTMLSCNTDAYISASNQAHMILQEHSDEAWLKENGCEGLAGYTDVGETTGLYLWNDGGTGYIIAEIGLKEADLASVQEDLTLYLDNIAVGGPDAYLGAYSFESGTSMAAPIVTGALAVIAKEEKTSSELTEEELEMQALERESKLLACVETTEELSVLCRTEGLLSFENNPDFSKRAPLIKSCSVIDGDLVVEGYFFIGEMEVSIDNETVSIIDWNENRINTDADFLENGSHVVTLRKPDMSLMKTVFYASQEDSAGRLLYEKNFNLPYEDDADASKLIDCSQIGGDAVICGGNLYTFSILSSKEDDIKELWTYSIEFGFWLRKPIPSDFIAMKDRRGTLAVLDGSLYLYGYSNPEKTEAGLWRFNSDDATWTKLQTAVPIDSAVCAFKGKLFFIGKSFSVLDPQTETLTALSGELPVEFFYGGHVTAASGDRLWIYYMSTDKNGEMSHVFVRASYQEETETITTEDMTSVLKDAIGGNFDYWNSFNDSRASGHFTLAGLPDGVAVIGSSIPGEDTHIISDTGTAAELYDRTSSYHQLTDPIAAYGDGWLYVLATSPTEAEAQYFRATQISQESQVAPGPAPSNTTAGSSVEKTVSNVKTGDNTVVWPWILLLTLAGLTIAAAVIMGVRRKGR